jgi:hypothetical protein
MKAERFELSSYAVNFLPDYDVALDIHVQIQTKINKNTLIDEDSVHYYRLLMELAEQFPLCLLEAAIQCGEDG